MLCFFLKCAVWQWWIISLYLYLIVVLFDIVQFSDTEQSPTYAAVWQKLQEYPPPDYRAASFPSGCETPELIFNTPLYVFFLCCNFDPSFITDSKKKHQIRLYNTKENYFKPVVPTFISKQSSALFGASSRFKSLWIIISSGKDLFPYHKSHSVVLK